MFNVEFLSLDQVIDMQADLIERFGGSYGIRSRALLESAVHAPQASMRGKYLHKDIFEMGATYLYHLIKNHPFIDGNKRIGTLAALTFFSINDNPLFLQKNEVYELGMLVACSSISKCELTLILHGYSQRGFE